jgi:diguanylate cyclase (GGDEF)-like protein/PAS domain S-box-containing protein
MSKFRAIYRLALESDIASHTEVQDIHALWTSLHDDEGVPRFSLFNQGILAAFKDDLAIMLPVENGAYYYAHLGNNIAQLNGASMQDKKTSDFNEDVSAFLKEVYAFSAQIKKAVYACDESAIAAQVHCWHRFLFPFYDANNKIACIVTYLRPSSLRHQVWKSISDIVGLGVASLEPIRDKSGVIYDYLTIEAAGIKQFFGKDTPGSLNELLQRQISREEIELLSAPYDDGHCLLEETIDRRFNEKVTSLKLEVHSSNIGLILNLQDVTDIRQAQLSLVKRSEELKIAQKLGRIGGWRKEFKSKTYWWSQEIYDLLGLKPGAFVPTTEAKTALFQNDDAARTIEAMKCVLDDAKPRTLDVSAKRGDGAICYFTIHIELERDKVGNPIGFIGTIQDITARKEAEIQLEKLAYFDPLTSLPNRAMFKKELEHRVQVSMSSGKAFFLMLMDLDKFKEVNDSLGHSAGDALLERVARDLREIVPSHSLVARLGGDEFAILFQEQDNAVDIDDLASHIVMHCNDAFLLDQGEVQIGISIGIAEGLKDGIDGNALLKNADLALYNAKDNGRGRYSFYKNIMSDKADERMSLARDLKKALADDKLELHFQPLVAMASNKVMGFEALLRWNHPERGYVPPSEFIPVAESSSLICDLGFWAMTKACKTLKEWLDAGNAPVSMAVNVSAVQFWQSSFEDEVKEIIANAGIDPQLLTLEVTESVFLDQGNMRVRNCFQELARIGVNLAIDDFGTGYSSLGYLSEMPFEKLKIDRSFVTNVDQSPEKRKLLQGIVGLARGLGMTTVVEGAETLGEILVLKSLGCNFVQGFYYAKPQPFNAWSNMIKEIEGTAVKELPANLEKDPANNIAEDITDLMPLRA